MSARRDRLSGRCATPRPLRLKAPPHDQPAATPHRPALRVDLCAPRGFCAGVVRAIDIVERALRLYGAPVYVRHEIVHNKYVVDALRRRASSSSRNCPR